MELLAYIIGGLIELFLKLPGPLQGTLIALLAIALAYRQGWNDRVHAVHRSDIDRADATKRAGLR